MDTLRQKMCSLHTSQNSDIKDFSVNHCGYHHFRANYSPGSLIFVQTGFKYRKNIFKIK